MAAPRTVRSRSVLYVVALSALTLLAVQRVVEPVRARVQDSVSRLDQVGARAAKPANKAVKSKVSYDAVVKENERLRRELDKANAAALRFDGAIAENRELKALHKIPDPDDFASVTARIIGGPLNNTDQTVRIDRGSNQGVAKDNPVVSASGLIGRVVRVNKSTSDVMLITDPNMSVGVRFARSGEVGSARGQGSGEPLRIDLVASNAPINRGDVVETSGFQSSRYPARLPVGRVDTVRSGNETKEVTVRPGVDLHRIRFVRVLTQKDAS